MNPEAWPCSQAQMSSLLILLILRWSPSQTKCGDIKGCQRPQRIVFDPKFMWTGKEVRFSSSSHTNHGIYLTHLGTILSPRFSLVVLYDNHRMFWEHNALRSGKSPGANWFPLDTGCPSTLEPSVSHVPHTGYFFIFSASV
jgi:hypothetical protein